MGDSEKFWPTNRGFDDWFGFTGGGRNYWPLRGNEDLSTRMMHNDEPVSEEEVTYLTDDLTREAVRYIGEYANISKPFFMYLAYNAPHTPNCAMAEYLKRMEHQEDGKRAVYGAMVAGMDEGIGQVIQKLKETGQYENTLIFFYSDNGGSSNGASCGPYRGHKGMVFEGGIRIPFLVSWPAVLKGGKRFEKPVIALDIYPTILSAAQIDYPVEGRLDRQNLFPFLDEDQKLEYPERSLFWRTSEGLSYAVRQGDYKLIKSGFKDKTFLFNLASDPYEMHDLSQSMPEKFAEMKRLYDEWNQMNMPMKWTDPHPENVKLQEQNRQSFIKAACAGEHRK